VISRTFQVLEFSRKNRGLSRRRGNNNLLLVELPSLLCLYVIQVFSGSFLIIPFIDLHSALLSLLLPVFDFVCLFVHRN